MKTEAPPSLCVWICVHLHILEYMALGAPGAP